ncbi:exopolysaccharide biosynthesis protein [Lapidilactobacillus concavus DSM 17758]|uniref:Capsular polysaccharide biosynthesis protein CpsC n=1 Tax=Lapidilactobacillus concavus DSM 17758 TaxID=1423735 RepID=A0A0R1VXK1_9LACO|nr:Wzz/FepE/Etk N-terminal domain-containing protein [Lapidilactobacillus concavus]KRM07779.1 exopolysaccharide biosynthesis protein [Lapidilactobacillus concavus DSM 17758]GEL13700.1 polysaccharide biosynthesis protein [Lapidilactobacillus concavus]
MDQTISIESILKILRKHLRLIIASTIACLLVSAVATYAFMTPKYQAGVDILVNRKQENNINNQLSDQQADVQMINTYKDIITKSVTLTPVRKEVREQLGYDISTSELQGMISVTNQQNSQVFTINVTDTDAARSATIANIIAKTFQKKVKQILSINNVTIIASATKPKSAVSPRKKLNLMIGFVLGLLIGVGLAFLRELTDHNVKDIDYLTDELGLTKLGIVSHYHTGSKKSGHRKHQNLRTREQFVPLSPIVDRPEVKTTTQTTGSTPIEPLRRTPTKRV